MIEVLVAKDISRFTEEEKVKHYEEYCAATGLDPRQRPFEYIWMDDSYMGRKLVLYLTKEGAAQLRAKHGVSITGMEGPTVANDIVSCKAFAKLPDGRVDVSTGSVSVLNLKGKAQADAALAAETKAKRRVTISICGLGVLDETEVQDVTSMVTKISESASAPAPQVSSPAAVATATAKEVTPTPEPVPTSPTPVGAMPTKEEIESYRDRLSYYRTEVLPKAGLVPGSGLGSTAKVNKFMLHFSGIEKPVDMTKQMWENVLKHFEATAPAVLVAEIEKFITEAK